VKRPVTNRPLRIFLGARLGLAVLLLALAPFLPGDLVPEGNVGVLALALLAAVISSGVLLVPGTIDQPRRLAWFLCVLDTVLVTAVVSATGGPQSIFTFLYVLSVIAAAVLLSRTGAVAIAGAASALYIGLVFGRTVLAMTAFLEPPRETTALEVMTMFLDAGTLLVVAIVAGGLAERFHETRQELETRRRDLRDLQAFKDLIFHSVGTGLVALDGDHTVTAFNRAAAEITGLDAVDVVGRHGRLVFGPTVPLAEIEATIDVSPRTAAHHETTFRRPDGVAVPVRMTFSALTSGDGTRLGLIAACEDLSAIREMEARMRLADRLASLGRMAANIAHEIRNPLASLSGAIEALTAQATDDDDRGRLSGIVLRESDRLNQIIKNFLEYARPAPLTTTSVNVADLVDEVLVLLEHGSLPATIKIGRDFPAVLPWSVDAPQFRQALWNLCRNAVEAMSDGGELAVSAAVVRGQLEVSVTDTGEGIAPSDLPQIFEPFFSTKSGGSGLGLALVHRIVADHGGRVDVRSTPGVGTTFILTVPAGDA
jgi:two-component system sensor histidine kinase PilS (NtrC family)